MSGEEILPFEWYVLSQVFGLISFIGIIAISIHTGFIMHKFHRNNGGEMAIYLLSFLSLATYLFFALFSINQFISGTTLFRDSTQKKCATEYYIFQIWCYGLGKYFMYNLFVARLYTAFKDSAAFAYPPWVIKALVGASQLYLVAVGIPMTIAVQPKLLSTNNPKYYGCTNSVGSEDIVALAIAVFYDFLFSVGFLILFIRKLNSLRHIQHGFLMDLHTRVPTTVSVRSITVSAPASPKSVSHNSRNEKLDFGSVDKLENDKPTSTAPVTVTSTAPIDTDRLRSVNQLSEVIRKQTILVCTAVGSTFILLLVLGTNESLSAFAFIDPLINTVCVWLLMQSNATLFGKFDKMCCFVCTADCCQCRCCEEYCVCNDVIARQTAEMEETLLSRMVSRQQSIPIPQSPKTKSKTSDTSSAVNSH